jgi:hypothetical protein
LYLRAKKWCHESCFIAAPGEPASSLPDRKNDCGGMMKARSLFEFLLLSLVSGAAFAGVGGDFATVPEPGMLELLALGGVVAAVVAIRNRRK